MRNLLIVIICLTGLNLFSQVSLIGFDQPACGQTVNSIYTYTNYPSGSHGGGYTIYRNGVIIKSDINYFGAAWCSGLFFLNDSTGFVVVTTGGGSGEYVYKTSDYGQTWISCGGGMPQFIGFYAVNAHYGYLLTTLFYSQNTICLSKCSDLPGVANTVFTDYAVNSDKYIMDTLMSSSLCNIDSLNIFIKNNSDTVIYHINKFFPIIGQPVNTNNCAGNAISVPYNAGMIFNTGNVFTAQLSDASGSFVAPTNIGSLISTTSGTINAIIPSGIPVGNGYKIRVVSNDPVKTGTDNEADISITDGLPLVNIASSSADSIICVGSVVILSVTSSATTYTWGSGATTASINVTPFSSTVYTLTAKNACGISTETMNIIVDTTCSYVRPGDVNGDTIVNYLDILELGLHYNQTGPPRATISNNWHPYIATNWNGIISNGKNLNNSDCNGDGTVNSNDTLAVFNNYNYTYIAPPYNPNADLRIIRDQLYVAKGTWGSASIFLGDSMHPISNVNGVAFFIRFMVGGLDSVYIEYQNSFLNPVNQNLNFQKHIVLNDAICAATTHTNNVNVTGYGKIATLKFKLSANYPSGYYFNLMLGASYKSDNLGNITTLYVEDTQFYEGVVGLETYLNNKSFSIMPNPADGLLNINSSDEIQKIEVLSPTGQILLSQKCSSKKEELDVENFSNGVYFIKLILSDGRSVTRKVVVNH